MIDAAPQGLSHHVSPRYTPAPYLDMECALRAVFEIFALSSQLFLSRGLGSAGEMSRPRAIWTRASEELFVALAKEGHSAPFIARALAVAGQPGASQATVGRRLAEWRARHATGPRVSPPKPSTSVTDERPALADAARLERLKVAWLYS